MMGHWRVIDGWASVIDYHKKLQGEAKVIEDVTPGQVYTAFVRVQQKLDESHNGP